jgi:hypothetical protein
LYGSETMVATLIDCGADIQARSAWTYVIPGGRTTFASACFATFTDAR